jgi:hypothetical protein
MNKLDKYLEKIYLDEFIILPTIALGIIIYKKHLSKAAKACSNYKSTKKEKCMLLYKIKGRREQLNKIKQAVSQCSKDKHPDKCKSKALKETNKVSRTLQSLIYKVKNLEKQKI